MVSQIKLNGDKEVEQLSARDRELAREIVTFCDGYEEHWRWKKTLSRKFESNKKEFSGHSYIIGASGFLRTEYRHDEALSRTEPQTRRCW